LLVAMCAGLIAAACSDGDDDAESGAEDDGAEGAAAAGAGDDAERPDDPLLIPTDLGEVRGGDSAVDGVRAFLTIPYAAPPIGDDAWRPPQPREPYGGVLDATVPGPSCPQDTDAALASITPIPDPHDDCLTLNVWSPTDADDLPVMFWIHGGGFTAGSAQQAYYIGDDLAAEGVVVVSANYRLGAFGFLATDGLADESDDGSYGNYGLADQAAALEWVQRNVAAFGGDPGNVTIFGESAGGFSVCGHLASPASEGLFVRAIIESGGGCDRLQDGDAARAAGAALLEAAGCADIACLRRLPGDAVLAAGFEPGLVADGVRLTDTGRERAESGELSDIPVLIGSNADEDTLFTLGSAEPADADLTRLFGELSDDPDALLALYPAEDYDTNLARYQAMRTDVRFTCPTLAFADAAEGDTYVYHYTYVSPDDPFGLGATHGSELVPLFAHPEGIAALPPGLTGSDAAMSDDMQAAWVAFATNGDPGDGWEPYGDGGRTTVLDQPPELVDEIRDGRCGDVDRLTTLRR
jgi:para-nitrobenzyl esterase